MHPVASGGRCIAPAWKAGRTKPEAEQPVAELLPDRRYELMIHARGARRFFAPKIFYVQCRCSPPPVGFASLNEKELARRGHLNELPKSETRAAARGRTRTRRWFSMARIVKLERE
jgi:hypothetical protein